MISVPDAWQSPRMPGSFASGEAEGHGDVELRESRHLAVEPVEAVGAKAVGPGETGSKVAHAQPPHPFHRFAQSVVFEMKPLAQAQDVRCFGKRLEAELRRAVFAQQTHVEMPVVG